MNDSCSLESVAFPGVSDKTRVYQKCWELCDRPANFLRNNLSAELNINLHDLGLLPYVQSRTNMKRPWVTRLQCPQKETPRNNSAGSLDRWNWLMQMEALWMKWLMFFLTQVTRGTFWLPSMSLYPLQWVGNIFAYKYSQGYLLIISFHSLHPLPLIMLCIISYHVSVLHQGWASQMTIDWCWVT